MISEECNGCDYWNSLYGCIEQSCSEYQGRLEMEADKEHDRRKDDRLKEDFDNDTMY